MSLWSNIKIILCFNPLRSKAASELQLNYMLHKLVCSAQYLSVALLSGVIMQKLGV